MSEDHKALCYRLTQEAVNRADLQRDEFKRITAMDVSDEVKGICDRAISEIERKVPITVELEQLQARVTELEGAVKALPKVEREVELYTGKNTAQIAVALTNGTVLGTLYDMDLAKALQAMLALRAGMD